MAFAAEEMRQAKLCSTSAVKATSLTCASAANVNVELPAFPLLRLPSLSASISLLVMYTICGTCLPAVPAARADAITQNVANDASFLHAQRDEEQETSFD